MNPSILSIGNATKDIYLDINHSQIFKDEKNIFHYDLTFDDSTLKYERQAGIFGGIILSDKIFQSAHIKSFSSINPRGISTFDFENEQFPSLDRYIISHKGQSFVLTNAPKDLRWQNPVYTPDMIYIADANFSPKYLNDLRNYLQANPDIKLAFSLNDFDNNLTREFFRRAAAIFIDLRKPILSDVIDYSNFETVVDSLAELGVKDVIMFDGEQIIAGNGKKIGKIKAEFLNSSFYQMSIFKAAYLGEAITNENIIENLKTACAIAFESDFEGIVKPFFARQIVMRKSQKYEAELLRDELDLTEKLHLTAQVLVQKPKGIFAADESGGNIHKKFEAAKIADTAENRRRYREMFFSTPDIENYLSGVILFEETISQNTTGGENFVDYLKSRGMLVGVKLDGGLQPFAGFDGETIAVGLDNLEKKLEKYAKKGIDFAKWRVAFTIDTEKGYPSNAAIAANVQVLARYAKACQNYGIVPIVEPEVVFDGDHTVKDCRLATGRALFALFEELKLFEVDLAGTILKTNMVMAGKKSMVMSSPREVAAETLNVFKKTVPKELAGIVLLSGGQTPQQATENLQAITNLGQQDWNITYSYARALQESALKAWAGKDKNLQQAQIAFMERVSANSHALYKN